jgi:hypothetical protein
MRIIHYEKEEVHKQVKNEYFIRRFTNDAS